MTLVLVVNAGSTSVKLSAVAADDSSQPVASLDAAPDGIAAVAHRVVHGGARFRDPIVLDETVENALDELAELAPLHNPPALAGIEAARKRFPNIPHVAVFDTAFHATIPDVASTYAIPREWRNEWGIRRYGFQGPSVQWASEQVRVNRLVVCHLGGGCSVTAVLDGRSVDTTMGFTPLEGVPMATRSGSVDPGALVHLLERRGLTVRDLEEGLEKRSGLVGLAGTERMEQIEVSGEPEEQLALAVYAYRIASAVASMSVALGGLDAIVFTAGVGEHSAIVRARVCDLLHHLGVRVDPDRNRAARPDSDIQASASTVRVAVVEAREDIVLARAVRATLGPQPWA